MSEPSLLLADVEIAGEACDVRVRGKAVEAVGRKLTRSSEDEVVEGGGGALIPGLHDHHIHLLSAAAHHSAVFLGPPSVAVGGQFAEALSSAAAALPAGEWVRGVGYHESVAGEIGRGQLDAIVDDHPVRLQHRSGALWMLNSRALDALGVESETGRLFGCDELLHERLSEPPPSLEGLGRRLASFGVTGVTDATPSLHLQSVELLSRAVTSAALPQSVTVMGGAELASAPQLPGVEWGPVKILIADHETPDLAGLQAAVALAHQSGRTVAVHCVTATALALAIAALADTGTIDGDRLEHASVVSPEAAERIADLGLTVVTQPGFVATRGDEYVAEVEPVDLSDLYRCASLLAIGIAVGGSTDAPFGPLDPWVSIRAAIERRTPAGVVLGESERVSPVQALGLFLSPSDRPGGSGRRIAAGASADLCLLDDRLSEVLADPSSTHVSLTIAGGRVVWRR